MKIAISTIAKNESGNVRDFIASCKGADLISVLDTGSTDDTVALLQRHGAYAGTKTFEPFDFGKARNEALATLPQDIDWVVSIDLDERLNEGWRDELERTIAENPEAEMVNYWYVGDSVGGNWRSKIFKRQGFTWQNPIHEIPFPTDLHQPRMVSTKGISVIHLQHGTRDYEPQLNDYIGRNPGNYTAYVQRAHERLKKNNWDGAIEDLYTSIRLSRKDTDQCPLKDCQKCVYESGTRALAFIDVAKCRLMRQEPPHAVHAELLKAVAEEPNMRECWIHLADAWLSIGEPLHAKACAETGKAITENGLWPQIASCWGDFPDEIIRRADEALNK
jgi:glycosyltransferase involved in cell wall biosynthesis